MKFYTARELGQTMTCWNDDVAEDSARKLAEAERLIDDALMQLGNTKPRFPMRKRDGLAVLSAKVRHFRYDLEGKYTTERPTESPQFSKTVT